MTESVWIGLYLGLRVGSCKGSQVFERMSEMKVMEQRFFNPSRASVKQRVAALSRSLLKDDSGQSMTEYILILFMVVLLFNQLKGRFLSKMQGLVDKVGGDLDSATSGE